MRTVGHKDAIPSRTGKSRGGASLGSPEPIVSIPEPGHDGEEGRPAGGRAGRHVYRVGGFRIPSKDSVRVPKNRCAGRVKDLLRKRAEAPVSRHLDPTEIEPPMRKPPVPRGIRPAIRDFSSSPAGLNPGRGRSEPDDDAEDLDDE